MSNVHFPSHWQRVKTLEPPPPPPHDPSMESRVSRLEGQIEGHKFVNGAVLALAGLILAVTLAGFGYTFARVDQLDSKVSALPDQIKTDLRELNRAFSDAVVGTRQAQPQQPNIIVVPSLPQPAIPPSQGGGG